MSAVVCFFCFFLGLVVLCGFSCHFLSVILIFELLVFGMFCWVSFFFVSCSNFFGCYVSLIFLVFSVVESVIGLSLLVSGSRGVSRVGLSVYSFIGV